MRDVEYLKGTLAAHSSLSESPCHTRVDVYSIGEATREVRAVAVEIFLAAWDETEVSSLL